MQSGVGRVPDADAYLRIGREIRDALLEQTGAGPTDKILDIGCGSGRVARHFVDYLDPAGRYVGMDIMKEYVEWCERNIAPAHPSFHFYHQDIFNGHYNPNGRYRGSEYRFPFDDESFDLVFLTSVFTHLLPDDALHYLREISRLLKPGGRCFSTWFLLGHDMDTNHVSQDAKEERMEYGFRVCVQMLGESGLAIVQKPKLGRWRYIGGPLSQPLDQDRLILGRAEGAGAYPFSLRKAPEVGELDRSAMEGVVGSIEAFDPVGHEITLLTCDGTRKFRLARDANIRVNNQDADSRSLRRGQGASLRLAKEREGDARVAVTIQARERLETQTVNGVVEFVDVELRLLTLSHEGGFQTFELDPEAATVRVEGEVVSAERLRKGQRASIRYAPTIKAVGFREPAQDAAE